MTKTLADLTPEQRAQCVGMWCDTYKSPYPAIINRITVLVRGKTKADMSELIVPGVEHTILTVGLWGVIPRPDLSRAWNPDGTVPEVG